MKVIVSKENSIMCFDYEGSTYYFPPVKEGFEVEEGLYNYLKEIVPLAFNFNPKDKNLAVIKPEKKETKPSYSGVVFGKKTTKTNSIMSDNKREEIEDEKMFKGDDWYGDGLQDDKP